MTDPRTLQRWWVSYVAVAAAAVVLVLAAVEAVARVLRPLAHLGLVVLFAIVVAFVLAPLATRLQELVRSRTLAVVITFLIALAVLVGAIAMLAAPLVSESARLADQIPVYVKRLQSNEAVTVLGVQVPDELRARLGSAVGDLGGQFAVQAVAVVVTIVSGVVDLFLVLIIALYLLLDQRRIRTFGLRALPRRYREPVEGVEAEVARVFGAYVRGQLILALLVGIAATGALLVLGVPYALFLGVFAGVVELVPILGPVLGAVPAVLVALFQPFPLVLWVILAFVLIQQIESNLLVPRISGHAVGLHPLAAMLALLVGLEVGGIVGALFAVPLAGVIWVFTSAAMHARRAGPVAERGTAPVSRGDLPAGAPGVEL